MLPKIIETDPYLVSRSGSRQKTVVILEGSSVPTFEKVASEALEYCKTVTPTPGKTKILVLAMGASEYYGPNRNGDAFRESELIKHHHTFKTNSHVFRSHVNKDPAKAIGRVLESFYNHDMHRVELILELDNDKAASEVQKIRENRDVAVSMGCRIKYDVCSICGNKAPTRAEYCDHLKYEMGEIYPSGKVVCADNPRPNFFDISIVFRPADKTGYMLKKVARDGSMLELGDKSADLAIKSATLTVLSSYLRKAADIDKTIEGVALRVPLDKIDTDAVSPSEKGITAKWVSSLTPKAVSAYTSLGKDSLASLSRESFVDTVRLLGDSGVLLMTDEFFELLFNKLLGKSPPKGLTEKMVSLQKDIFKVLAENPEVPASAIAEEVIPSMDSEKVSLDLSYRNTLAGGCPPLYPEADLSVETIKVAGYGSVLYAAYSASLLSASSERGSTKLSNLVEIQDKISTDNNIDQTSAKLAYVRHRAMDILKNHGGLYKLSSNTAYNDLSLFKRSPEDYYFSVGRELLTV